MAPRVQVLGVPVDPVTLDEAVDRVLGWMSGRQCRFVVTPNLDHAVLYRENAEFRRVYSHASLIIADGMPMVWASRLTGAAIRERVAGSDLVPALLGAANEGRPLTVYLLGAAPGVAERAASVIEADFDHVKVVGTHSPALGFERDPAKNAEIVERINRVTPDLLVVGLGAPKQELWIDAHASELRSGAAICAGATIDFIAGHRQRAPRWMQRTGSEWLYRALSEPRRLLPRYARDAALLPSLLLGDWRAGRRP